MSLQKSRKQFASRGKRHPALNSGNCLGYTFIFIHLLPEPDPTASWLAKFSPLLLSWVSAAMEAGRLATGRLWLLKSATEPLLSLKKIVSLYTSNRMIVILLIGSLNGL